VLTVSLHANPNNFYPFFWGHPQERGAGAGLGYNINLPLEIGAKDDHYLKVLDEALVQISMFGADVIVVALGLDAYEKDPLQGLCLTTAGFQRVANHIAGCGKPLLLVQEGGYLSHELADNLTSFLSGLT